MGYTAVGGEGGRIGSGVEGSLGNGGSETAVSFSGPTDLLVRADNLFLGVDSDSGSANLGTISGPRAQAGAPFSPPTGLAVLLASGGRVRIASDAVVLNAGSVVYASGEGTAIEISGTTMGTGTTLFNNLAGPSALQTPGGRWLVHALDSAVLSPNFQPGGLLPAFWQYGDTPGVTVAARPMTME
jgi:hypothetical protein